MPVTFADYKAGIEASLSTIISIESSNPSINYIYVGDNVSKDFITPNKMDWITIGIKDNGLNIHQQSISDLSEDYLPNFWIESIADLREYFH